MQVSNAAGVSTSRTARLKVFVSASLAIQSPITSNIWRIDPKAEKPTLEVYARGVRNAYAFCWNDRGEMFATENGPDADAPEELNQIEQGRHYGFPYTFANWTKRLIRSLLMLRPASNSTFPLRISARWRIRRGTDLHLRSAFRA